MDFALTEELALIRDTVREFAEGELMPRAQKHDLEERIDQDLFSKTFVNQVADSFALSLSLSL